MSLVVFQFLRQEALVAHQPVVDERDTGNPVAVFNFSAALYVVLASGEVPHEVAPVHPVELVGEEELDVFPLCGHVYHNHVAAFVIGHIVTLDVLPGMVLLCMGTAVHTREQHVLGVFVLNASGDFDVRILFVGCSFLLADELRAVVLDARFAVTVFHVQRHLRGEGRAIEQRACAILLASQVFAQCEDVLRRVLVHRRVGGGADDDKCIRGISDDNHHGAEQRGVQRACRYAEFLFDGCLRLRTEVEPQCGNDNDTDNYRAGTVSVERDTQHGDSEYERECHTCLVAFGIAFVDTPDEAGCQQDDIYDDTRVEGHAQRVDEEQFEPAAHFHDTRHDAVEYGCYQYARSEQCQQGASGIGVGYFLVVVYQYDGGQAEQVQQVHADTQTGQVGNENQPAITVRLVGNVLPFQYEPEYDGSEQ